mgnify:CR=1 FL=1
MKLPVVAEPEMLILLKKVLVVDPKEDATVLACKKSFCTTKDLSPTKLLDVTEPLIPEPDVFGAES